MANIGNLIVTLGGNITPLQKQLRAAEASLNRFNNAATKTSNNLNAMGRSFTKNFTIPIVSGLTIVTKNFSDFDLELRKIKKTVDASSSTIRDLGDNFINLSQNIGVTRTQLNETAVIAGQLGVTADNLERYVKVATDVGTITGDTADDVLTGLVRTSKLTGTAEKDFRRLGDAIVETGVNLVTNESRVMEAATRIASASSLIGLSAKEVVAFAGAVTSVRTRVESAATAVDRLFTEMHSGVSQGGRQLMIMSKIAGETSAQFKKSFEKDSFDAIMKFLEGLKEFTKSGGVAKEILEELGLSSVRTRSTILALLTDKGWGVFQKAIKLASKGWEENIALTKRAAEIYNSFNNRMKSVWITLKNTLALLGEAFQVQLSISITKVKEITLRIQQFIISLKDLDDQTKNLIGRLILFSVTIGPILLGLSALISIVISVINPVVLLVTAIVSLIGYLVVFKKETKLVSTTITLLKQAFLSIEPALNLVINLILGFGKLIIDVFRGTGNELMTIIHTIFSTITEIINLALSIITLDFTNAWNSWTKIVMSIFKVFVNIFVGIGESVLNIIRIILTEISGFLDKIKVSLINAYASILEGTSSVVNAIYISFQNTFRGLWNVIIPFLNKLSTIINKIVSKIVDRFLAIPKAIQPIIAKVDKTLGKLLLDTISWAESKKLIIDPIQKVDLVTGKSQYAEDLEKKAMALRKSATSVRNTGIIWAEGLENIREKLNAFGESATKYLSMVDNMESAPKILSEGYFDLSDAINQALINLKLLNKQQAKQETFDPSNDPGIKAVEARIEARLKTWEDIQKKSKEFSIQLNDLFLNIGQTITDSLSQAFVSTIGQGRKAADALKDAWNSAIQSIAATILSRAALFALASMFNVGTGGFGSFIMQGFGISGAKANGGPVTAGSSYIVGEEGQEIFTPNVSGSITSNNDIVGTMEQGFGGLISAFQNGIPISGGILELRGDGLIEFVQDGTRQRNARRRIV